MLENRRNNPRKRATGPVRFYQSSDPKKDAGKNSAGLSDVGIILNASDSGLCFMSTCPLEVGQTLVIHCPWVGDRPEGVTVRWCRKAAMDLWRVGLQKTMLKDNAA